MVEKKGSKKSSVRKSSAKSKAGKSGVKGSVKKAVSESVVDEVVDDLGEAVDDVVSAVEGEVDSLVADLKPKTVFDWEKVLVVLAAVLGLTAIGVYAFIIFPSGAGLGVGDGGAVIDSPDAKPPATPVLMEPEAPTLTLFFDPRTRGLSDLDKDFDYLKRVLPGLNIERRCVDRDALVAGKASGASDSCVTRDGSTVFKANSVQAQLRGLGGDAFFSETGVALFAGSGGSSSLVAYSPFPPVFARRICGVFGFDSNSRLQSCADLNEVKPVKAQVIFDSKCVTCPKYPALFLQLQKLGLEVEWVRDLDYSEEGPAPEAPLAVDKYGQRYLPFVLLDEGSIQDFEPRIYNLLQGQSIKLFNNYVLPSDLSSGEYVGPKSETTFLELFTMPGCRPSSLLEDNLSLVKEKLGDALSVKPVFLSFKSSSTPVDNCEAKLVGGELRNVCSLFGSSNLVETRRQSCVYEKYGGDVWLDYVVCLNAGGSADSCLSSVEGVDAGFIEACASSDAAFKQVVSDQDFAYGKTILASPVMRFSDGETYPLQGAFNPNVILKAVCDRLEPRPDACDDVIDVTGVQPVAGFCAQ